MRARAARAAVRTACAAALLACVPAAGCAGGGEADRDSSVVPGSTLTIYASVPQQGAARRSSRDVLRAESLALEEAHRRVGRFRVRFVALDNALPDTGTWDASRTSVNARTAVRDPTTIAYLGDEPVAATTVSLPILNESGILQVSPTNTYLGLTRGAGAESEEPDRFYPSGQRTFARVIPAEHVQAAVLARVMADADCADVQLVDGPDAGAVGGGIAAAVERAAEALDLAVAATERFPEAPASVLPLVARIARENADCVVMGATADPRGAAALVRGAHGERPAMRFFAPSSLGEPAFLRALGPAVEDQVRIITPLLPLHAYPRAAQRFLRAFAQRYGRPPAIEAIYGYEAMKAVLHAIGEAGDLGNDRAEVVKEFFAIRDRRSVLGTYDIDENGDTTLSQHAVHRVRAGRLLFDGVVRPGTG